MNSFEFQQKISIEKRRTNDVNEKIVRFTGALNYMQLISYIYWDIFYLTLLMQ